MNTTTADATKRTAKVAPRMVYWRPTRAVPRPSIRRFGPSTTVVGPGAPRAAGLAGTAAGLGAALGTGFGACGAGAMLLLLSVLVGSLRNAINLSLNSRYVRCALGAHMQKLVVRDERADVQLVPQAPILVA